MATTNFSAGVVVQAAWLNDVDPVVYGAEAFGAAGDGTTNDYAALNSGLLWSVANRGILTLDSTKTYSVDVTSWTIPAGATLRTNGAIIKCATTTTSNTVWLTVADNVNIDQLCISVPTGVRRDRCVSVDGDDVHLGYIEVVSTDVQATAETDDFGVRVTGCARARIGRIRVNNYDRAIIVHTNTDSDIAGVSITGYVRGLWMYDNTDLSIGKSVIKTASVNAGVTAGHNGVLFSSNGIDSQRNVTLKDFTIENSGEHAIRIGGDSAVAGTGYQSNIFLVRPRIRNHGACGIKILGTDAAAPTARNKNIVIDHPIIEDGGTSPSAPNNRCGILAQFVDGLQITAPIIKPKDNTNAASVGIRLDACTEVLITNPLVINTAKEGIQIHAENDDVENVVINGGLVQGATTDGLKILCEAGKAIRRIIVDGTHIENSTELGFNIDVSAGTAVDPRVRIHTYNNTNGAGACDSTAFTLIGTGLVGATPLSGISANNGSCWSDGTTLNIRKAGSWTAL